MIFGLYAFISVTNFIIKVQIDKAVEEELKKEGYTIKNDDKKVERIVKYALESLIPIYHMYDIYDKTYNFKEYYYKKRKEFWQNGICYKEDKKDIKIENTITKSNDNNKKVSYDKNEKNNKKDKVLIKKKTYKR